MFVNVPSMFRDSTFWTDDFLVISAEDSDTFFCFDLIMGLYLVMKA